ncbi:MAG: S8 family serine peptidase [Bacillota bacterium]
MFENRASIAIIDDGVNEKLYDIGTLKHNIEITPQLKVLERREYDRYLPSHATNCAAIIRKYSPHASISSVKILNKARRGLCEQLTRSIEWCVDTGINIVNLSLGSIHQKDSSKIQDTVNKAAKEGLVIVAACSNNNIITYPSVFSNVIGVKCDIMNRLNEGEYVYNYYPNDGINITACSRHLLYKFYGGSSFTRICNSYAAPFITARVYDIVNKFPGIILEEIKQKLIEGAVNKSIGVYRSYLNKGIDWVARAISFRLSNKEGNFLKLKYCFEVDNTVVFECNCLCDALEYIKYYFNDNSHILKEIDTVIIDANNLIPKHPVCSSEKILDEITKLGKNVVYLDDGDIGRDLNFSTSDSRIKIWHPSIYNYLDIPIYKEIDMPVLYVYDFSGIHLIDLVSKLQDCFRTNGHRIISVLDTCLGVVCGLEYSPSFGEPIYQEFDPGSLKTICGLYNPDFLIFGINAINSSLNYMSKLNDFHTADTNIIITDTHSNQVEDFISLRKGTKDIILMPLTCTSMGTDSTVVFDLSSDNCINDLYNYIIRLYEDW